MPRIRGPVWEVNRQLAEEATAKNRKKSENTQTNGATIDAATKFFLRRFPFIAMGLLRLGS